MDFQIFIDALQPVLLSMLTAVATALAGYVVKWVNEKIAEASVSKHALQYELASEMLFVLIRAAEQHAKIGTIVDDAQAKKQWVLDRAQETFKRYKLPMDAYEIESMLEGVIKDAKNSVEIPPEWTDGL